MRGKLTMTHGGYHYDYIFVGKRRFTLQNNSKEFCQLYISITLCYPHQTVS